MMSAFVPGSSELANPWPRVQTFETECVEIYLFRLRQCLHGLLECQLQKAVVLDTFLLPLEPAFV